MRGKLRARPGGWSCEAVFAEDEDTHVFRSAAAETAELALALMLLIKSLPAAVDDHLHRYRA